MRIICAIDLDFLSRKDGGLCCIHKGVEASGINDGALPE